MPMFEFECTQCSTVVEEITNDRELKFSTCNVCGGVSQKIMSAAGWDIKGGGVYRHGPPETTTETQKVGHRRISSSK